MPTAQGVSNILFLNQCYISIRLNRSFITGIPLPRHLRDPSGCYWLVVRSSATTNLSDPESLVLKNRMQLSRDGGPPAEKLYSSVLFLQMVLSTKDERPNSLKRTRHVRLAIIRDAVRTIVSSAQYIQLNLSNFKYYLIQRHNYHCKQINKRSIDFRILQYVNKSQSTC